MNTRSTRPRLGYLVATVIVVIALSGCAAREKLEVPAPIDIPDIAVPDVSVPEIAIPAPAAPTQVSRARAVR